MNNHQSMIEGSVVATCLVAEDIDVLDRIHFDHRMALLHRLLQMGDDVASTKVGDVDKIIGLRHAMSLCWKPKAIIGAPRTMSTKVYAPS
jgi:hypothetical protein